MLVFGLGFDFELENDSKVLDNIIYPTVCGGGVVPVRRVPFGRVPVRRGSLNAYLLDAYLLDACLLDACLLDACLLHVWQLDAAG